MGEPQEKLGILAEHYSETYTYLQLVVKKRDRLFVIVLVIAAVLMIFMTNPEPWQELLNQFLSFQAGNDDPVTMLDVPLIGTLLWFGLLAVGHTYFQTVLHIQRQYDYLYHLEEQLNSNFEGLAFTREGEHYTEHSKGFSTWTKIIFWGLFPVIMLTFIVMWMVVLYRDLQLPALYTALNTLMPGLFLTSMVLYLIGLLRKENDKNKQPAIFPATESQEAHED